MNFGVYNLIYNIFIDNRSKVFIVNSDTRKNLMYVGREKDG